MWFENGHFWLGRHSSRNIYVVIKREDVLKKDDPFINVMYLDDYKYMRAIRQYLREHIEDVKVAPGEIDLSELSSKFEDSKNKLSRTIIENTSSIITLSPQELGKGQGSSHQELPTAGVAKIALIQP